MAELASWLLQQAHFREWSIEVRTLCGWHDEGRALALVRAALVVPERAARAWWSVIDSDGLRGHFAWRPEVRSHRTACGDGAPPIIQAAFGPPNLILRAWWVVLDGDGRCMEWRGHDSPEHCLRCAGVLHELRQLSLRP